jgi:hypothetical protein
MGMPHLLPLLVLLALSAVPARAQTLADLLAGMRAGGGWVALDIENGRGELLTRPLPTAGLRLTGCVHVWGGHSGRWEIDVEDTRGDGRFELRGGPGATLPIEYETGAVAQLDVEVRWSEPRDTTLLVWVGFDRPGRPKGDSCEPVYGSGP